MPKGPLPVVQCLYIEADREFLEREKTDPRDVVSLSVHCENAVASEVHVVRTQTDSLLSRYPVPADGKPHTVNIRRSTRIARREFVNDIQFRVVAKNAAGTTVGIPSGLRTAARA